MRAFTRGVLIVSCVVLGAGVGACTRSETGNAPERPLDDGSQAVPSERGDTVERTAAAKRAPAPRAPEPTPEVPDTARDSVEQPAPVASEVTRARVVQEAAREAAAKAEAEARNAALKAAAAAARAGQAETP